MNRLNMTDSQILIAEYAKTSSEAAFRELVARYIDLVLHDGRCGRLAATRIWLRTCRKRCSSIWLRRQKNLPKDVLLEAGCIGTPCYVAATILRGQRRRQARERQAVEMKTQQDNSEANLEQVAPILDEAINKLGAQDRAAIMLRFFEHRDLRSVGIAAGKQRGCGRACE